MTEFQSRRELREAERQGLVAKPEQIFDLPTGQINLPLMDNDAETEADSPTEPDLPTVGDMLTRKRIREMERQGLLDPLTGAVSVASDSMPAKREYDEVLAETEEPITSTINAVTGEQVVRSEPETPAVVAPTSPALSSPAAAAAAAVAPTDIFHSMAVDLNARKPRVGIIVIVILVVLAAVGTAAYMLGIFK